MRQNLATTAVVLAVLATAAVSLAIERAGAHPALDPVVSTGNGDPRGLLAAFDYLKARGDAVEGIHGEFLSAIRGTGVLVLAAPVARTLTEAEAKAVAAFARRGGVVVAIAPTGRSLPAAQPALADALGAKGSRLEGRATPVDHPGRDPSVAVVRVHADPLLGGGERFVARVAEGERLDHGTVLARAGGTPVISRRDLGAGRVYLLSTPTLLENHRLDLGDDLWLVEGLAALARAAGGPVRFDEVHDHVASGTGPSSILGRPAVLAATIQLGLVAAFLLLALGRRFGPVRPLSTDLRRSSLEYVDTLAALYRQTGDDPGLATEVRRAVRRRLLATRGIPESLAGDALARRLANRSDLTEAEARGLLARLAAPGASLVACVQAAADLEARLAGRKMG